MRGVGFSTTKVLRNSASVGNTWLSEVTLCNQIRQRWSGRGNVLSKARDIEWFKGGSDRFLCSRNKKADCFGRARHKQRNQLSSSRGLLLLLLELKALFYFYCWAMLVTVVTTSLIFLFLLLWALLLLVAVTKAKDVPSFVFILVIPLKTIIYGFWLLGLRGLDQ